MTTGHYCCYPIYVTQPVGTSYILKDIGVDTPWSKVIVLLSLLKVHRESIVIDLKGSKMLLVLSHRLLQLIQLVPSILEFLLPLMLDGCCSFKIEFFCIRASNCILLLETAGRICFTSTCGLLKSLKSS